MEDAIYGLEAVGEMSRKTTFITGQCMNAGQVKAQLSETTAACCVYVDTVTNFVLAPF